MPDVDANLVDPNMVQGGAPGDTAPDAAQEPYGSQVLRRAHEDSGLLMKDYDQMHHLLDHEGVKGHMEKHMQYLDKFMTDTGKLHSKSYKDLPAIADADGDEEEESGEKPETMEDEIDEKDMDESGESAGAEAQPEEPSEEEEDDKSKSLKGKKTKSLSVGEVTPGDTVKLISGYDKYGPDTGVTVVKISSTGKDVTVRLPDGRTHPFRLSELSKSLAKKGKACPPCTAAKGVEDDGSLKDHEKQHYGEASGFLKELSQPESQLDEEGRFKAYHYHKTMEGVGQVSGEQKPPEVPENVDGDPMNDDRLADTMPPDSTVKGLKGRKKSEFGAPEDLNGGQPEVGTMGKDLHPARKAAGDASGLFKSLSTEKAFGDPHRKNCADMAKAMDDAAGQPGQDPAAEETDEEFPGLQGGEAHEPGEMGEKRLLKVVEARQKTIDRMNETMGRLVATFTNGKH